MIEIYFGINAVLFYIFITFAIISPFIPYCRNNCKKIDFINIYKNINKYLNKKPTKKKQLINELIWHYLTYLLVSVGLIGSIIFMFGSLLLILPIIYIIFRFIIISILNFQTK